MGDIVPSVSIAALVSARAGILKRFEDCVKLMEEAQEIAQAQGIYCPALHVHGSRYGRHGSDLPATDHRARDLFLRQLDSIAWKHLLSESGIRTFMDADTRQKWEEQLEKGDVPELTEEAVIGTFGSLYETRGEMFERGVIACFRKLSWDYKTNNPFRFGKRIVMRYLKSYSDSAYPNTRAADELDDLMRVFRVLEGLPELDHRDGMRHFLSAAMETPGNRNRGEAQNDYLHIRWFKNGNAHITFLRPDLVDQLNGIIAKHYPGALPAPQEPRRAA